uniref:ABC transmembrane type-1 domain-containing protein n=1 Tax=Heterorhabditis bacteriophora TaxID=37862 RepID=A0A1I7WDT9_HETBA
MEEKSKQDTSAEIGILQAMQFALTQSYIYFSDMLTYGVGAYMIYYGYLQAVDVIIAATCANFAGWSVIFASATFADFTRANSSAKSLFTFMKKDSPIEALLEGEKPKIDNSNVSKISLHHLRSNIALVGQEPVLFKESNEYVLSPYIIGSILENITLGLENICLAEVRKACKLANAANFIEAFPLIIWIFFRIILLDEATSALDTESEKMVQAALNEASLGRTSITIAHRLSTISGADSLTII